MADARELAVSAATGTTTPLDAGGPPHPGRPPHAGGSVTAMPLTAVLVLTDVVGSTRMWAEHAAQMNEAMGRHHELVHSCVRRRDGWLPVDQGEGDAVFAAFISADAAVAAVAEFQQALAAQRWPDGVQITARVAVHAGAVISRDGNLFGSTVNRCARLRGLAAGGQILLSTVVFELVRDQLPAGLTVTDLGEHRMKDLTRPEHVYQLDVAGLPNRFPPLASLDRAQHNLPVQSSSFLGRAHEIADLVGLVRGERLVTVVGFGGMGKTRLALQVAGELARSTVDGVWFIDLSTTDDVERAASEIASVLGIAERYDGPRAALLAGVRHRKSVLILDNLEQLLPPIAVLIDQLLRAGPDIRILATSREPLRLRAEHEYFIEPLPVPGTADCRRVSSAAEMEALSTVDAVRLFVTRAAAVRKDFALTVANAAAVASICVRLDGMPLALELAAARCRSMSPDALLARLDQALALLTGGSRDLPSRQQTLRATVDWSYGALSPEQQRLLDRLSVFPGSFTLEAAEAVCASDSGSGETDVLDDLTALIDHSLMNGRPAADDGLPGAPRGGDRRIGERRPAEDRYGLLVTIRAYAAERLASAGLTADLAARHARYYWTARTPPPSWSPADQNRIDRLAIDDLHNIRGALAYAQTRGDPRAEFELARIAAHLQLIGSAQEARAVLDHAAARSRPGTAEHVELLWCRALVELNSLQRGAARDWGVRCLAEARALGDPSVLVLALALSTPRSLAEARQVVADGEQLLLTLPAHGLFYPRWYAQEMWDKLLSSCPYGEPDRVEAASRRNLAATGERGSTMAGEDLGAVLLLRGRLVQAERLLAPFERPQLHPMAERSYLVKGAIDAAILRTVTGDFAAATVDLDIAEDSLRLLDLPALTTEIAYRRAVVERATGRHEASAARLRRLLEDADADMDILQLGQARWLSAVLRREAGDAAAAAQLLDQAWSAVVDWESVCLPLVLECLLERSLQVSDDDPVEAVRLIGVVNQHWGDFPLLDAVDYDTDAMLAGLRSRLGDDRVGRILAAARAQPLTRGF